MPGHMGHEQVTVQNLEVVKVDAENNLILVKGAVPGPKKSLVTVKETSEGCEVSFYRKGGTHRWQTYLFTIWKAMKLAHWS